MTKKIVIIDLWTDDNRGDNALQVGLIKALRAEYTGSTISGIFRFGHNEFDLAKSEISDTLQYLDFAFGGLRRTSYAGERANRVKYLRKLHSFFSFLELALILLIYRTFSIHPFLKTQSQIFSVLEQADLIYWKGKNFRAPNGLLGIQRLLSLMIAGFVAGSFTARKFCVNASFWEIDGYLKKMIASSALKSFERVTVRDISSIRNAATFIDRERIIYCKDLSYIDIFDRLISRVNLGLKNSSNYSIALTITQWGSSANQLRYVNALRELIAYEINKNSAARFVIVPHVVRKAESSDVLISQIVSGYESKIDVITSSLGIEDLLDLYASCSVLIGTRMHSCIFAAAVGTPFVAIAYDEGPKWEILHDLAAPEFIIPLSEINSDKLIQLRDKVALKSFDLRLLAKLAVQNIHD
jgi:colanic acid/amylovoran biosynthesis protein